MVARRGDGRRAKASVIKDVGKEQNEVKESPRDKRTQYAYANRKQRDGNDVRGGCKITERLFLLYLVEAQNPGLLLASPQYGIQRGGQLRAGLLQLRSMRQREFAQNCPSGGRQVDPDFSLIVVRHMSRDCPRVLQSVYEFYSAVMLDEQPRSDLSNRWFCSFGKAMYHEQQLVLLRLEAMVLRFQFAEMSETSDLSAELG
jgi:hypothetical protein